MSLALYGIGTIGGMALIYDAEETITLLAGALTVRGMTWISKKVAGNLNFDASQIIDFAGWSLAGVSVVKIIGNAIGCIDILSRWVIKVGEVFSKIGDFFDAIIFWS